MEQKRRAGKPSASVERVRAALTAATGKADIREMAASTRTAEEAAAACGVAVGQIVKSLIFKGADSGEAWLVLVSGANRVHEKRLGKRLGEKLVRADADFVRQKTGFAIGGVAPLGHLSPLRTVIDADLFRYAEIWAAAGSPSAVFRTDAESLRAITGARVEPVT